MDVFLNFKKKKEIVPQFIQLGSQVDIIKGNHKGLIGTIKFIKEHKWVYIITCMNELKVIKLPIEFVQLRIIN